MGGGALCDVIFSEFVGWKWRLEWSGVLSGFYQGSLSLQFSCYTQTRLRMSWLDLFGLCFSFVGYDTIQ